MQNKTFAPEGRVIHKGSRLELRLVTLPAERGSVEKEVVVHHGAVVILPFVTDTDIILIRNARFAIGQELWELPAGTLAPDELPEDCASRELKEETGYEATSIEPLGSFFNAPGWSTFRLYSFVARGLTAGLQQLEKDEKIDVHVISVTDVCSMIAKGQIADGKTLASLAIYAAQRGLIRF
ncbi:MAG TPA: NUDIX hydrolase [Syntrophales bacterium]|nr:NUDIX hydrolase [Syntrophales bacterium]